MTVIERELPAETEPVVPARLVEPLRIVAGRASLLAWLSTIFRLLALVSGVWLITVLALGSGRKLPFSLGIAITVLAWAAVIAGGYRILRPMFRRRHGLAAAALLVDNALPDTEERLSSAVELAQEKNPAFRGSPELVAVLLRQAEHHADNMDPATVISGKNVMRWLGAVAMLALVWFLLLVVLTPNMLLGMQRLLTPWTAAAGAPTPQIDVHPGDAVLAQGDTLEITVDVKPPEGASLDNGNQPIEKATIVRHFINTHAMVASPDLTSELDRTGPRSFRFTLPQIQQSFTYQVFAEGGKDLGKGESPTYTVTIQILPAVADVQVDYDYPPYTRLDHRTVHSHDGAIEALTGTKVQVTVHTTEPVKTATITLDDDGAGQVARLPLQEKKDAATGNGMGAAAYGSAFTITRSTHYRVDLAAGTDRKNIDNTARPITALVDSAPHVEIKLPDPAGGPLPVRPDDVVPMRVVATDDFGVTKIEAIVQVDDRPAVTLPVSSETGETQATRDWDLNLQQLLRGADRLGPAPRRVAYQFKATDTRDPNPQEGLSVKQYLQLDKSAAPLAQRMDTAAVKDLGKAVEQAAAKLRDAQSQLDAVKKGDTDRSVSPEGSQRLATAQQDLNDARNTLDQAADQSDASRVGPLAQEVRNIADHEVKDAQEQSVKAGLASDQPEARQTSIADAQKNVQDALDKLNQASKKVDDTSKGQPLAQALERIAEEQHQLASQLAQNPNDPQLRQQQQELQKKLDQVIKDHPELQKTAEDARQASTNDLVQRVQDLERAQQPINQQLERANGSSVAPDKARALAQKQGDLNQDIARFASEQSQALKDAGNARPPESDKLDPIVKELQNSRLEDAARDQRSTAATLQQAANQLDGSQKKSDEGSGAREKAAEQAAKDAATAADAQQDARDLQKQIQDATAAHNPPTRPGDPANQKAGDLASQMRQDAVKMSQNSNNAAAKAALQAATKAADAARQAARSGNAQAAQQQLSQAADQLAQAAQAEQAAAGAAPQDAAQPNASKSGNAAQQAQALADRQRDLAQQTSELAQGQQDAANLTSNPSQTAEAQRALANKMDDAAKAAQALKEQTQGPAPQLSQKAAQAQQALERAAQAQKSAADSTSAQKTGDAAAKQGESANRLADAEQALTGQKPGANGSSSAGGKPNSTPSGSGNSAAAAAASRDVQSARDSQSQAANGNAGAAKNAADQLDNAAREIASGNQNSNNGPNGQPASPGDRPGQSASQGQPGNNGASAPGRSGSGASGSPGGSGAGQSASGAGNANGSGAGAGNAAGSGSGTGNGGSANGGSGGAGAGGGVAQGGGSPGAGSGAGRGSGSGQGNGSAAGGGGGGIDITMNGRNSEEPKEVKEAGIAPSDWGRLPPDMQTELLHSAQQPGPPGYRDMIKNYYSRIARLQAQGDDAK